MSLRTRLFAAIGALLAIHVAGGAPAFAWPTAAHAGEADGSLGIRLLEASSNRSDDPRARLYIVDHINPGTTISRRFEITNTSSTAQHIAIFPGAAEIRGNAFVPSADRDANELSSWVAVDRPQVVAPPHSRIPLTATISIPKSASRGERYGGIWAQVRSAPAGPASGSTIRVVNGVGIRIYLDVGPGGDPPSDFRIESLLPGRTEDGLPTVRATVHNTGERALDLSGRMWLSEGPNGLQAGPFAAQVGTTLAPGSSAPVSVMLRQPLPDGPWKVALTLESGRVHRTVTGTLTFPVRAASWGLPALLNSAPPWMLAAGGALTAVVILIVAVRRLRRILV
ncbi:COG1361 family protein [Planotetraspora mira]|uniref:Peptidase n=1 Tax=Planotetraspora mira TaxID=58121 RepID=A0A8J3XA12_9ACTN|nr:hypothetical protein [Planotetraspora mira]GII33515.1 hypothetical protein Pmi06nite_69570 [Planotetraspora mira]